MRDALKRDSADENGTRQSRVQKIFQNCLILLHFYCVLIADVMTQELKNQHEKRIHR